MFDHAIGPLVFGWFLLRFDDDHFRAASAAFDEYRTLAQKFVEDFPLAEAPGTDTIPASQRKNVGQNAHLIPLGLCLQVQSRMSPGVP